MGEKTFPLIVKVTKIWIVEYLLYYSIIPFLPHIFFLSPNWLWLWDDDSLPVLRTAERWNRTTGKKMKDVMLLLTNTGQIRNERTIFIVRERKINKIVLLVVILFNLYYNCVL